MYDIDNEPPAHVQAVKVQGDHYVRDYLVRQPGGWRLSGDPEGRDTRGTVRPWREATTISFRGESGEKFEAVKTDLFKPGDKVRGRDTLYDREVTGTVADPAYFNTPFHDEPRLRVYTSENGILTHVKPETATLIEDENPYKVGDKVKYTHPGGSWFTATLTKVGSDGWLEGTLLSRGTESVYKPEDEGSYHIYLSSNLNTLNKNITPLTEEETSTVSQTPALVGPKPEVRAPAFVTPFRVSGSTIYDADDKYVTCVEGDMTESLEDEALAEVIKDLLNEKFGA